MNPLSDPLAWFGSRAPGLFRLGNHLRLWANSRWLCPGTVAAGPRHGNRVALTFDDGPDPRWTPAILDCLREYKAQASFFMLGRALAEHPDLACRVASEGHQVGTHLYNHARALLVDRDAMLTDLDRAIATHVQTFGQAPHCLRFPYGRVGRMQPQDLVAHSLTAYHWTFSSHDSRAESPERIIRRVESLIGPGDIVLMHDGYGTGSSLGPGHRDHTVAALPRILDLLQARNLEPVTLDQLFEE